MTIYDNCMVLVIVLRIYRRIYLALVPLQSRKKTVETLSDFGMNENFDLENHLPQQIFPPLALINVALPPKFP